MIDKTLLQILACPICKSDVKYSKKKNLLFCINKKCNKKYKVVGDVPVMLI